MPPGRDLQAATVWISAAARAGTIAAAALPGDGVESRDGAATHVAPSTRPDVGVLGPDPEAAVADLLAFTGRT